jgi:hypothetical protein
MLSAGLTEIGERRLGTPIELRVERAASRARSAGRCSHLIASRQGMKTA